MALSLSACGGGGANSPQQIVPATPGGPAGGQSSAALSRRTMFVGFSPHSLVMFDEGTGSQIGSVALIGNSNTAPVSLSLTADARTLFAMVSPLGGNCNLGESKILKIDAQTGKILIDLLKPEAFTDGALSADGTTWAGVANGGFTSSGEKVVVSVFSTSDLQSIGGALLPHAVVSGRIALSAHGTTAYVTDPNSFTTNVYKIDFTIPGPTVTPFYAFPSNRTYAILRPFLDPTDQKLFVETSIGFTILDANTGAKIGEVGLPANGLSYFDGAQTASRATIFAIGQNDSASNPTRGTLISTASNSIDSSFVAAANVQDMDAVSPDGAAGFGFIPKSGFPYVDVYSLPSGTLVNTLNLPSSNDIVTAVAGQ